ncbi:type II secretion system F family protein [Inquilinus limosus]|uniref:type II secretion system F family protein n=1 Tax=Inquilinus limosus TaxID=171674 RepID=UPI00042680C1|nr:type II secretion system F family protein [Inquilinus limosus]
MTGLGFLLFGVFALFIMAGISLLAGRAQRRRQQQVQERLQALRDLQPAGETAAAGRAAAPARMPRFLRLWLAQADLALSPRQFVGGGLLLAAAVAVLAWLLGPIPAFAAAVAVPAGALYGLRLLANKRLDTFIAGLPMFLDAVRQLLMVGNSTQQAMLRAAENASPALQRYLQPMIRRINNGAPIPEAVSWLAARLGVPELYMLATAIETNFRFGGRLSAVLANLVQILRDRARVGRELKAATAEIRFSAIVLGLMPILAAAMIGMVKPSYVMFFLEAEQGPRLAAIAIGLQLLGILVMRRIMRLEF